MVSLSTTGGAASPPLEKGRSATPDLIGGSRVGIKGSRFDLTRIKTAHARQLRRQSTDVETRLWQRLRNKQLGVDFRRQHPAGQFVLDFYCPELHLAIELDGGQHGSRDGKQQDARRDEWLGQRGVMVLRFWNSDLVENFPGVLETIAARVSELKSASLLPTRPPSLRWRSAPTADLPFSRGGKESQGRN